jgi:stearoyl-CoA desaturase (delta-9 desaturase)
MAIQGTLREWVAKHRLHHKYSDDVGDPHSPREGFFWAHMGWLLFPYQYPKSEFDKIVGDIDKEKLVKTQGILFPVFALLGFVIPFLLFGWEGVLLSSVLRLMAVYHLTFSVNSLCHMPSGFFVKKTYGHFVSSKKSKMRLVYGFIYVLLSPLWIFLELVLLCGSQNKWFKDDSRNNWLMTLITLGDSMHNNHHYDPRYAYHGYKWYNIDPSKWLIWALRLFIWNIRAPRVINER